MSTFGPVSKHPEDISRHTIDWRPYLDEDIVDTGEWFASSGLEIIDSGRTDTHTYVDVRGGVIPFDYKLRCKMTTIGGVIKNLTIIVRASEE